jgi:hypothetical protein
MKKIIFVLLMVIGSFSSITMRAEGSDETQAPKEISVVWGNIERFTNRDILLVDGRKFDYGTDVIIDSESTEVNAKGNVRILLDPSGKAKKIYFNGIDTPVAFKKYKK